MKKYSIDCFEKKNDTYVTSINLPSIKEHQYRIILKKWNKTNIIDQILIDKKIKMKLQCRFKIKINTRDYDCFFSEANLI